MPTGALAHGELGHDAPAGKRTSVVREQQAWGIAGKPKSATRTIALRMSDDMRFSPERIVVRQGETIRFVQRNDGAMLHEMVIGTGEALAEHAELMKKFPGMEHDEPWMAHVPAGGKGEIVWTFNRPGRFEFACLIPGHYEAGMVGTIEVTPASPSDKPKAAAR